MRLGLVELELAPEAALVLRLGAPEADEDGRVVGGAQDDAALVEVAMPHPGLVDCLQGVDGLPPAQNAGKLASYAHRGARLGGVT